MYFKKQTNKQNPPKNPITTKQNKSPVPPDLSMGKETVFF